MDRDTYAKFADHYDRRWARFSARVHVRVVEQLPALCWPFRPSGAIFRQSGHSSARMQPRMDEPASTGGQFGHDGGPALPE